MSVKPKTYFIITFGCAANEADSERITGYYQAKGWRKARSALLSDVVVFNTCSVRQSAEDRVVGQIYQLDRQKKLKKTSKPFIVLTGCMTRFRPSDLYEKIPGLQKVYPIDKYIAASAVHQSPEALVPIMSGCDNFCAYCVVPFARGREQSRPLEEIISEVQTLVKKGYCTVMLLGQNVNSYHKNSEFRIRNLELREKVKTLEKKYHNRFAVLLALLNDLEGLEKIKFLSSNPHDFEKGIIQALQLPKIDRYLHLAVQSGDDQVLRSMNRRYTAKQFLALIKKIKKAVPTMDIGTDIIVGFPGETTKQFQNTVRLCRQIGFKKAYVSKYSPRPQTAAFKMADDIPFAEKKRRWQILDRLINHYAH
jgi:tRNA-2-methylthio-N6-dimethylallyladenosine synthase